MIAPFDYLTSLPSKGVRELAMQALNFWYQVPPKSYDTIKSIVNMLHNASLMYVIISVCMGFTNVELGLMISKMDLRCGGASPRHIRFSVAAKRSTRQIISSRDLCERSKHSAVARLLEFSPVIICHTISEIR